MTADPDADGTWLGFEVELLRHDPIEWVLLTGDRVLVAALGLLLLSGVLAAIIILGGVPFRKETPVLFLLFALIAANFTLIAIVTSLSQLVLGRRLESPGEIRRKIDETIDYREEVGAAVGRSVVPVRPDAFLLALYRDVDRLLETLETQQSEGRTRLAREELAELTVNLRSHCSYVTDVLRRPASGVKHALFVSLDADFETAVYRAWHLQWEHADEFAEGAAEPLARLAETLQHIEVAGRLFKTVFIESEIAELSRFLLYVGIPVQLAAVGLTLAYTAPGAGPPLAPSTLRVVVPMVIVAGFAPFVLLSSYVVRLTVVAGRTADSFPFSSQLSTGVALRDGSGPDH
ncbi:hypothetical protein [Halosegnis sp.]|uniref:hypothetical protein n=1 Tax=Halosegnis sp. TaxID=2864959 RepID=UPI0035D503EC